MLAASPDELGALLTRAAAASDTVLVIDMPAAAQTHRTYDDYLTELAATATTDTAPGALSIIGPRNRISKLTKGLMLLSSTVDTG